MRNPNIRASRIACAILAITFAFGTASCWMPSFDPALSTSMEMDAFFAEKGVDAWRKYYSFTVKEEQWEESTEFVPFRNDLITSDGGFLVHRDGTGLGIAKLERTGGLISFSWSWGRDFNPLGARALVEPLVGSIDQLLILSDFRKLELLDTENPLNNKSITLFGEGQSPVAFGTESMSTGAENQVYLRILVREELSGSVKDHFGQFDFSTSTLGLGPDEFSVPRFPFPPGWVAYDPALGSKPWSVTLNLAEPGLWRFGASVSPPPPPAELVTDLKALGTGTIHDEANPRILAEGPFFTDIYSLAGVHLGWLPTGSWRFAFEWWDSAELRWISVFTRFAVVTDSKDDKGNIAFAQVEGVPTSDLLAFAAEKLGN